MCIAIEYQGKVISWADAEPRLPVLRKDGEIEWVTWGLPFARARSATIPAGGWARLESIRDGKWRRYGARPVKIPASRFAERDADGTAHWFELTDGLVIQGAMIAVKNREQTATLGELILRVYVVTEPAIGDVATVHDRMPRTICRVITPAPKS